MFLDEAGTLWPERRASSSSGVGGRLDRIRILLLDTDQRQALAIVSIVDILSGVTPRNGNFQS
jgi:hypothetical protein